MSNDIAHEQATVHVPAVCINKPLFIDTGIFCGFLQTFKQATKDGIKVPVASNNIL